jgi:hypothetical protein
MLLRRQGWLVNVKRVRRIHREEKVSPDGDERQLLRPQSSELSSVANSLAFILRLTLSR